jgi:NADPH:quinone reductase-like Zn-dependent oxidoreductase
MVVRRHGPPEVLEWREVPDPAPTASDVLIHVRAVGINFADLLARMGLYPGAPGPPFVPGLEVSGIIERPPAGGNGESGSEVFRAGDRVAALTTFNAYAELVAVPAQRVYRLPEAMSFEDAAAIPVNYLTAYHSMFQMGNLQPGDRVLIHGAAGGVGIAAVQLGKARRLVVFGTAGTSKQEYLRQIGVDHPIDYTREDFVQVVQRVAPTGIEMVMDAIGGKSFAKSARCLGTTGRLVVYGFSAVAGASGKRSLWRAAKALAQTPRFHPMKLMERNISVIGVHLGRMPDRIGLLQAELAEIFRMYAGGQIKPVIGKTFPLNEAAAAHHYIHNRKNIGKVVLTVP